jgi:hypothetical protein
MSQELFKTYPTPETVPTNGHINGVSRNGNSNAETRTSETSPEVKSPLTNNLPDVKHVSLKMYDPQSIENGSLETLGKKFYGNRINFFATYNDAEYVFQPDSIARDGIELDKTGKEKLEAIRKREEKIKKRYQKAHPEVNEEDYLQIRQRKINNYLKSSTRAMNRQFFSSVSTEYDSHDPREFANRQFTHAANAAKQVSNTLYPASAVMDLRNEASLVPVSPALGIETMTSIKYSPSLREEEKKIHLNALLAADLDLRNGMHDGLNKLSQIQRLLDMQLFEMPIGATEIVKIKALFYNQTNSVGHLEGIDQAKFDENNIPEGMHIKETEMSMRRIKGTDIRVYTSPDYKSMESSIIKSTRKALTNKLNGGSDDILPTEYVLDTHRMLFTVDGGPENEGIVAERIKNILRDPKNQEYLAKLDYSGEPMIDPKSRNFVGSLIDIENFNKDNSIRKADDAQSSNVKFTRFYANFDSLPVPIEIKVQGVKLFLNDEFEVGTQDKETGLYTGASHKIYEYNRSQQVQHYFLAVNESSEKINLQAEAQKTLEKIVCDLRQQTAKKVA